ncbi:hypothetical protein BJ322DRAFT_332533 [Thelephora terrestris]|uniref:Yeast cell wall synthesis Kre9/Knh1-like N-terminal domain-containing protein n=1 Tax=Thelephora terrestris TaxID=56493 RepID=A0A9P6H6U9_9AGAM|nr:hypothetical protein BJ322DRAFT_332533 [Thelephora terrestris]
MRAAFAALATLPALALATIQITSPNTNDYWVQNTSKSITWTYAKGDPTPISIFIVNSDVNVLNGAFSVDEYVDVSTQSYTITNVTLNSGTGYAVEFVNPSNYSDVYAISPRFEVKVAGTPPSSSTPAGSSSSSGPGSSSSTSSSSKPSGTTTTGTNLNGALSSSSNIFFSLATCGFVAVASFFA